MRHTFRRFIAIAAACLIAFGAQAGTLLPNGEQTFIGNNGQPLNGGTVMFYVPSTTTPKDTYQDPGQTILNTNPVVLDSSGRAIIYGTGAYRQVVKDGTGNIVWDQTTGDTSSSSSYAGLGGGTANAQTVNAPNFSSQDGQSITFVPSVTSTGAVSVNPNGTGPIGVLIDTSSGPLGTTGGELTAGNETTLVYDATRGAFHIAALPQAYGGFTAAVGIPAAPTTDLGTVPGHFVYVFGSATITSFGSSCSPTSPIYDVTFQGASTITYNSAAIVTPSATNIITTPGDTAVLACFGGGLWRLVSYFPAAGSVPAGGVMAFNLATCPVGWIPADGSNPNAPYNVDLRGAFVRGLDNGRGYDPGRALNTYQADQIQNFTVTYQYPTATTSGSGSSPVFFQNILGSKTVNPDQGSANFGAETRPKNVSLLYCVKQ